MGTPEPSSQPLPLSQVWFQNRRSKERRMKQLSALGARRHAFFRSPRRMRPLGGRLDESEMLGSTPYTYYGGKGHPGSRPLHLGPRGAGPPRDPLPPFYSCGTFGHEHTFIDNPQHSYTHPQTSPGHKIRQMGSLAMQRYTEINPLGQAGLWCTRVSETSEKQT